MRSPKNSEHIAPLAIWFSSGPTTSSQLRTQVNNWLYSLGTNLFRSHYRPGSPSPQPRNYTHKLTTKQQQNSHKPKTPSTKDSSQHIFFFFLEYQKAQDKWNRVSSKLSLIHTPTCMWLGKILRYSVEMENNYREDMEQFRVLKIFVIKNPLWVGSLWVGSFQNILGNRPQHKVKSI